MSRILAVDDMEFNRHHLRKVLESEGFEVDTAGDGRTAWNQLRAQRYDLVVTDLRMPDLSGLELLAKVRAERLPVGVIVLTAFGDPDEALRAMKAGADDFVAKPYEPDHLRHLIKRILDRRRLIDELEQLRKQMRGDYHFHTMVSKSPKIRRLFDLIEQVGPLGSTVLIHGETGTGKELVAQAVHAADTRRAGPFVALNCAVLNDSLLESELFGHEKGSFTGAERRKIGRFEMANGGTLLLDEIGDIPPSLQAKLLRVLQSGTFERVGGTDSIHVDVRIVAATHKVLEEEVKKGHFRADLFYRLNVIRIDLPPLRERTEDIPFLVRHFAQHFARLMKKRIDTISSETMNALVRYPWPGNIRELQNVIERAVILSSGKELKVPITDLKPRLVENNGSNGMMTLEEMERRHILHVLEQSNWVFSGPNGAAARLGMKRPTLQFRMRKLGISRPTQPH